MCNIECKYYKKSLSQNYCAFEKICGEAECIFSLKQMYNANSGTEQIVNELKNTISSLEKIVDEQEDEIRELERDLEYNERAIKLFESDVENFEIYLSSIEDYVRGKYDPEFDLEDVIKYHTNLIRSYYDLRKRNEELITEITKYKDRYGDLE